MHIQRYPDEISPSPREAQKNENLYVLRRIFSGSSDVKSAWGCDFLKDGCAVNVYALGDKDDTFCDRNQKLVSFTSPAYIGLDSDEITRLYEFVVGRPEELRKIIPGFCEGPNKEASESTESCPVCESVQFPCPKTGKSCDLLSSLYAKTSESKVQVYHINNLIDYSAIALENRLRVLYEEDVIDKMIDLSKEFLDIDSELRMRMNYNAAREGCIGYS